MKHEIQFLEDFAGNIAGDKKSASGHLPHDLVARGVAVFTDEKKQASFLEARGLSPETVEVKAEPAEPAAEPAAKKADKTKAKK